MQLVWALSNITFHRTILVPVHQTMYKTHWIKQIVSLMQHATHQHRFTIKTIHVVALITIFRINIINIIVFQKFSVNKDHKFISAIIILVAAEQTMLLTHKIKIIVSYNWIVHMAKFILVVVTFAAVPQISLRIQVVDLLACQLPVVTLYLRFMTYKIIYVVVTVELVIL